MSEYKVQFHFGEDLVEVDAGCGVISLEVIPKWKKEMKDLKHVDVYITMEADEADLLCATLQLFSKRLKEGRYPECPA